MENLNILAILVVGALAFGVAAIWFGPLFGNLWMKIHGWEKLSKKELKKQEEGMGKLLVLEAGNSIIMIAILAFLLSITPEYSALLIAFLLWLGFLYPTIVSAIIWGGDKKKWQGTKITLLAGFNFIVIMLSAFILSIWK